jgi:hypothetical protein
MDVRGLQACQQDVVGNLPRGIPMIVDYQWRCARIELDGDARGTQDLSKFRP